MKGDIAVSLILKIGSLVIVLFIGSILLKQVAEDILENTKKTSSQVIALDISNLLTLAQITSGDITLDYKLDTDKKHTVFVEHRIVAIKSEDGKRVFKFSIPVDAGEKEKEQTGLAFRVSKIENITRIEAQR